MKLRIHFLLTCCLLFVQPRVVLADTAQTAQVIKLLSHSDREFRGAALDIIRKSAKGTAQTTAFAAEIPKLGLEAQAELITALGERGDVAARTAVVDQLASSKDQAVRAAALSALGGIGNTGDIPLLLKSLAAGSDAEQQAARTGLIRMHDSAASQAIAAEVKGAAVPVRARLLEILASRRATEESAVILAATTDSDASVRTAAMNALGQIGKPAQLSAMLPGVLKAERGSERDNAERNIAEVCKRMKDDNELGNALIAALDTLNVQQRDELMSLVGRVGGKRLIQFVGEIATGKDASRRAFGIDALSKWPDASPADTLLAIASQTKDANERRLAFQGYVKVSASRDQRNDKQRLERMKQAMQQARTAEEKTAVINRTRTAYDVESMRFIRPYLEEPEFCQIACDSIVELAHHRQVRDPNKEEFDKVLDQVIKLTKNKEHIERANRYKRGETWERPKADGK